MSKEVKNVRKEVLGNYVFIKHTPELEKQCASEVSGSVLDEKVTSTVIHNLTVVRASNTLKVPVGRNDFEQLNVQDGDVVTVNAHGISNQNIVAWGNVKYYLLRADYLIAITGKVSNEELEILSNELDSL